MVETDNQGNESVCATLEVLVEPDEPPPPPPPQTLRPTAVAGASTNLIPKGGTVVLNGTGSRDNDTVGPAPVIVSYKWDLKNVTTNETLSVTATPTVAASVTLNSAGEWEATLVVTDNDNEKSDPAIDGSTAHATIKVVGVTFAPNPVKVNVGATSTVTATIVPPSAVGNVSFRVEDMAIANATPVKLTATPGDLSVKGVKAGTTKLLAEIVTGLGSEVVGTADIEVNSISKITLSTDESSILAGGVNNFGHKAKIKAKVTPLITGATLSAKFLDGTGLGVHKNASITPTSNTTDGQGECEFELLSSDLPGVIKVEISASAGSVKASTQVEVEEVVFVLVSE